MRCVCVSDVCLCVCARAPVRACVVRACACPCSQINAPITLYFLCLFKIIHFFSFFFYQTRFDSLHLKHGNNEPSVIKNPAVYEISRTLL